MNETKEYKAEKAAQTNEQSASAGSEFSKKNKKLFFSGVLILTVSNIMIKLFGLLLKVPLTNMIGEEGMGYFNLAYSIYKWFYMISTAGLPVAVSIMISEARVRNNRREAKRIYNVTLLIFVIVGLCGTCAMFFGSGLFAKLENTPNARFCIMAIAPTLFLICISSAIRGYFQGFQNMFPTAASQIIEAVGKLTLGILFAYYALEIANGGEGYPIHIVAAYAITGLVVGVLFGMVFLIISRICYRPIFNDSVPECTVQKGKRAIAKTLILTAIPVTLSSSVLSLTDMIDSAIVIRRLMSIGLINKEAVSLYGNYTSLAVPMFNMPPALIYPISYSIVPLLSGQLASNGKEHAHKIVTSALKIALVIALPCAFGLSVLSAPILSLLFDSEKVATGAPLLSILAFAVTFIGIIAISTAVLQAYKFEKKPILSMLAGGVVKLISSYILVGSPSVGIYGTPISTVLCYFTIASFNLYFMMRYTKNIPNFADVFIRPLLASVACAGSALGAYKLISGFLGGKLSCLLAILCAMVVYLALLLLLRAVKKDDVMLLPKGDKIYALLHRCRLM